MTATVTAIVNGRHGTVMQSIVGACGGTVVCFWWICVWDVSFCVDLWERITPDSCLITPDFQIEALVRLIPSMRITLVIQGVIRQVVAQFGLPFWITVLLSLDYP